MSLALPGSGQIYNDQLGKGITVAIVFAVAVAAAVLATVAALAVAIAVWIYGIVDAPRAAAHLNAQQARARQRCTLCSAAVEAESTACRHCAFSPE